MRALRANSFGGKLMILLFYHPCSKYNEQTSDVNGTKPTIHLLLNFLYGTLYLRNGKLKRRAYTQLTLHPNFAAMQLNNAFGNGKPQPGSFGLTNIGIV